MPKGKGRRLWRSLREGGKVLLAGGVGVLSLAGNFYFVWTGQDWTNRPYYELYTAVITVTAATAAVGIGLVVYTPEVVKVFGETFLAKRYAAGREDGIEEGVEKGLVQGVERGREEMRAERDAEWLKFLEEHPEATGDQLKELLRGGEGLRNGAGSRNGK